MERNCLLAGVRPTRFWKEPWRAVACCLLPVALLAAAAVPARAREEPSAPQEAPAAQAPPAPRPASGLLDLALAADLLPTYEAVLEQELAKRLGPARRWRVDVAAAQDELRSGRLPRVEVRGEDLRTRDGLILDVALTAEEVLLNVSTGLITDVQRNLLVARLSAANLERYLQAQGGRRIRGVDVRLDGQTIRVAGKGKFLGLRLPLEVEGTLAVRQNTIHFLADDASIAGLRVPRRHVRRLEERVNPIITLKGLGVPARITWAGVRNDALMAHAVLDLSALRTRPLD